MFYFRYLILVLSFGFVNLITSMGQARMDFLNERAKFLTLNSAILRNDLFTIECLINSGNNINFVIPCTEPALISAVQLNNFEIVRLLISSGINLNLQDRYGYTALFWAVETNNKDLVELLVLSGADANIKDNYGNTPLMVACEEGYNEIVGLLLQAGADYLIKNRQGKTAYYLAIYNQQIDVAKILEIYTINKEIVHDMPNFLRAISYYNRYRFTIKSRL